MGIFSLPGIGQNFTFFGVNPSTGFADTFYKGQANKRAEEEAANPTTKGDQINDYAKDVYMRTTNILPVYADQVKKEVGDWIASTNDLQKRYGKNFTNSQEFTTGYLGIIQKLQNYQSSSKQFNEDMDKTSKDPDKSQMDPALVAAVQKNSYPDFVAANGNNNPFYQGGSKIISMYRPEKAHELLMKGLQPNQFNSKIVRTAGGMIDYEQTKTAIATDPVFAQRAQILFLTTPTINKNNTYPDFLDQMVQYTQGEVTKQVMQNAAKPATPISTNIGGAGYFNNSRVAITTSQGNNVQFKGNQKLDKEIITRLIDEYSDSISTDTGGSTKESKRIIAAKKHGRVTYNNLIKRGYKAVELDAIINNEDAPPEVTPPTKIEGWNLGTTYNLSFNSADPKTQNIQVFSGGLVFDGETKEQGKTKDITGSLQSVIEVKEKTGKSNYYAVIKTPESQGGKTKYILYDKNIASQIQGMTTDPKISTSYFNLYEDGTIGGGKKASTPSTTKTPAPVTNQGEAPANQKLGPGQSMPVDDDYEKYKRNK